MSENLNKKVEAQQEVSIESKLKALYELQRNDSNIDKIKILRGELPLEVQDLEDEIAGFKTRITNFNDEIKQFKSTIGKKKNEMKESEQLIKKYKEQQMKVRNNREYDSISKEIEYQSLEIELSTKRIKEFASNLSEKRATVQNLNEILSEKKKDIKHKKSELSAIIKETKKDEVTLSEKSQKIQGVIEPRLLNAYSRIRNNARNGLSVVPVYKSACGGCFNKIPPQRQLDVASRKKIIVCEYCGRILIDSDIVKEFDDELNLTANIDNE